MRRHKGSNVNLSSLIGEIASRLGGGGGGHDAAAGGRVLIGRFDEFLKEVKRALTGLKNTENNKTEGDE
jgi:nanoRNase/pAp phosphatase (c-di-AMP/oligoRNAs hydrolase)